MVTLGAAGGSLPHVGASDSCIGGQPAWHSAESKPPAEWLLCGGCGGQLQQLVQLHAPLPNCYDRTLSVLACRAASCSTLPGAWQTISCEKKQGQEDLHKMLAEVVMHTPMGEDPELSKRKPIDTNTTAAAADSPAAVPAAAAAAPKKPKTREDTVIQELVRLDVVNILEYKHAFVSDKVEAGKSPTAAQLGGFLRETVGALGPHAPRAAKWIGVAIKARLAAIGWDVVANGSVRPI